MSQVAGNTDFTPSDVTRPEPSFARILGMAGLGAVVLGSAAVIANQFGPRWIPETMGYLFAAVGLFCLLFHAARDSDVEVRRVYGLFAAALIVVGIVVSLVPGPLGEATQKSVGYHLLPWGALAGILGLVFSIPFVRHEDEEKYRNGAQRAILGIGGLLCVGSVIVGLIKPDTLIGPGLVLALVGLGFIAAYLGTEDTSEGLGYRVAAGLGILGGVALVLALGQTVIPTILHDGPAALKDARQDYDAWHVLGRAMMILAGLLFAGVGAIGRVPTWVRGAMVVLGLAWAIVFLVACFAAPVAVEPRPYMVPYGLVLGGIGLLYLFTAIGSADDTQLVVLIRRELASYFYSPIAYLALLGATVLAGLGYGWFTMFDLVRGPLPEPILQRNPAFGILAAFQAVFLVPALTMRLFSEEKRTGTLEVLLTAPVNEAAVVFSKFFACWVFYILCWLPAGLFLIALRSVGGEPFDYRPLLSYYLAVAATGAGFIGMGLFFSSLTRNQVVAAVLTFAGMMNLLLTVWFSDLPRLGAGVNAVLGKVNFLMLWNSALVGQLPLTDVLIWLSIAAFWLFLTMKILEARKWN
ncbi:MAG: ABC transporter permease [Bacteroidales bacterium]|nr:ABC transporter permease [Bacteroidales bacterium]